MQTEKNTWGAQSEYDLFISLPHSQNITRSCVGLQGPSLIKAPHAGKDHKDAPLKYRHSVRISSLRRKVHTATTYWPHQHNKLGFVCLWRLHQLIQEGALEQMPGRDHAISLQYRHWQWCSYFNRPHSSLHWLRSFRWKPWDGYSPPPCVSCDGKGSAGRRIWRWKEGEGSFLTLI